jgi:predicted GNAT superfamily acetyltransferase
MRQFGLGTALKYHQAEAVRNILGVDVMCCTFDPLTGVNANRNIRKLGMRVEKYIVSCYQDFGGRLNRKDVPSDRFFASWDLTKKAAPPQRNLEKSAHDIPWALRSRIIRIQGRSGMNDAQAPEEYDVLSGNQKPNYVLAEIPENFYRLIQETDVAEAAVRRIPRDWRMASRRVFSSLMESGYLIQDFQRITLGGRFRNLYILQKGN